MGAGQCQVQESSSCAAWLQGAQQSPTPHPPQWESAGVVPGEGTSPPRNPGRCERASDSKVIQVSEAINLLLKEGAGRTIKELLYLGWGRSMGSRFRE